MLVGRIGAAWKWTSSTLGLQLLLVSVFDRANWRMVLGVFFSSEVAGIEGAHVEAVA
jgi:hypothetical protein